MTDNLYRQYWVGSDFPVAYEAFTCGQEAAVNVIAKWLADQPSSYEDAVSEDTWKERLTKACEGHL